MRPAYDVGYQQEKAEPEQKSPDRIFRDRTRKRSRSVCSRSATEVGYLDLRCLKHQGPSKPCKDEPHQSPGPFREAEPWQVKSRSLARSPMDTSRYICP